MTSRLERLERERPFFGLHAQEMIAVAGFEKGDALGHFRVAYDNPRSRRRPVARGVEGANQSVDVVAVDSLYEPTKRFELGRQRLEIENGGRRAVGLLIVDVDDADQVVELVGPR